FDIEHWSTATDRFGGSIENLQLHTFYVDLHEVDALKRKMIKCGKWHELDAVRIVPSRLRQHFTLPWTEFNTTKIERLRIVELRNFDPFLPVANGHVITINICY